jgi:putative transposase
LLIAALIPPPLVGGRPRTTDIRRVVEAILYLLKTGCQWRNLPHDFPPWRTVYGYFVEWRRTGVVRRIHQTLVKKIRREAGRSGYPSIAILDSQSVKTGKMVSEDKGYDGGKHVKGRKRHLAVDSQGLIIGVSVTSANTHDQVGGKRVITRLKRFMRDRQIKKVYADGGYDGQPFRSWVKQKIDATVRVTKGIGQKVKGFIPIAKRWVVERTFGWLGDYRRLDKDQERKTRNSVAMIRWASINLMLNRLTA